MIDLGEATNIAELLKAVHSVERRFESAQAWFRGHRDSIWQLVPSAHRRHRILESQFLNHFRFRAPAFSKDCPPHTDYEAWLPLARHFGLPTRLLDWTESLMVALYFAVTKEKDEDEKDGHLFVLAPGKLNSASIGGIIPFLTDDRVQSYVMSAFNGNLNSKQTDTIAVLAPRTHIRMAAQLSNYTIHGTRLSLDSHTSSSDFLGKIVIPKESKQEFRSDLSVSGIRHTTLFPDLSTLAKEIAEYPAVGPDGEDLEST